MDDINSIVMFEGAKTEAPAKDTGVTVEKTEAATPAETPRQERDETGKFKAKEEAKSEPETVEAKAEPKPEAKPELKAEKGQMSALLAERNKRQEAERALAEMRERIAALEAGKADSKADIFTDPDKAVGEIVAKHVAPIRERFFNQSVRAAEKAHADDWQEVSTAFVEMAEKDASLWDRLRNAEDPGEFIYEAGSNTPEYRQKQLQRANETVSAKDAEIAELKRKLEQAERSKLADVPESLNRQPSGAIPSRNDDEFNINRIVRFQ